MPMLHNESEAVYVSSLSKFARDVEEARYQEDWLGYCMLWWPWHTSLFPKWSKMWQSATKFERRQRAELFVFYFVAWYYREFFLVLPEERKRMHVARPAS